MSSFNRMYALYIFILKFKIVPLSTRGWEGSGGRKSSKAGWRTWNQTGSWFGRNFISDPLKVIDCHL